MVIWSVGWCFAIVNAKLAEIFFEKEKGKIKILGHTYVKKAEYRLKKELQWIEQDTKKFKFVYRNGMYKDKTTDKVYPVFSEEELHSKEVQTSWFQDPNTSSIKIYKFFRSFLSKETIFDFLIFAQANR